MEDYAEYASHAAMINRVHAVTAAAPDGSAANATVDAAEIKRTQKQAQKAKKTLKRL